MLVCGLGFQKGVEKVSKFMMIALLAIMIILAIRSVFLPGAMEGVKFYLIPDFSKIEEVGLGNVLLTSDERIVGQVVTLPDEVMQAILREHTIYEARTDLGGLAASACHFGRS